MHWCTRQRFRLLHCCIVALWIVEARRVPLRTDLTDCGVLTMMTFGDMALKFLFGWVKLNTTLAVWTLVHVSLFGDMLGPKKFALFPAPCTPERYAAKTENTERYADLFNSSNAAVVVVKCSNHGVGALGARCACLRLRRCGRLLCVARCLPIAIVAQNAQRRRVVTLGHMLHAESARAAKRTALVIGHQTKRAADACCAFTPCAALLQRQCRDRRRCKGCVRCQCTAFVETFVVHGITARRAAATRTERRARSTQTASRPGNAVEHAGQWFVAPGTKRTAFTLFSTSVTFRSGW